MTDVYEMAPGVPFFLAREGRTFRQRKNMTRAAEASGRLLPFTYFVQTIPLIVKLQARVPKVIHVQSTRKLKAKPVMLFFFFFFLNIYIDFLFKKKSQYSF